MRIIERLDRPVGKLTRGSLMLSRPPAAIEITPDKIAADRIPSFNVERLIGSIRREFVHHIIVPGEAHLRRILKSYARYYNETRTHLALGKDAPVSRPVQRTGAISSCAILGGLHHHYDRVKFSVNTGWHGISIKNSGNWLQGVNPEGF